MNKKIASIICLSIALIFCFPSVPALAESDIRLFTTESVDGYFEGNFTYENNSVSRSDIASSLFLDFDSLSSNDQDNYITTLSSLPSHSDNYLVFSAGNSVFLYDFDSVVTFVNETSGFGGNTGRVLALSMDSFSGSYYNCTIGSTSWSSGVSFSSRFASGLCYFYFDSTSLVKLLYTPLDLYSRVEADITNLESSDKSLRMYVSIYNGNSFGFTNYAGDSLPFYNGSEIIDPDAPVGESNSNHLYLNDFNIGFCKPYHMENLYSAGGGYCYFTYNFDSWVNSHSSDYEFQIITQLNVDGTTTTYNSIYGLDLQGCTVLPFKGLATGYNWDRENVLFVEYEDDTLFNNYNRGYVYCIGYDKYIQPSVQNTLFRGVSSGGRSTRTFVSSNGATHRLLGDNVQSEENYFNGESSHSQFLFTITVHLVDKLSGDVSGSFVKTFNLLTGVSNVTSNSIRDNTNPYQVSSDDIELPVIDSGGGYDLVSGYGTNNQIVTFSSPDNIKLFIDNGLKDFVVWYNTDPSVGNAAHSFWNNMGIFKDNPATSLYQQYFGFLPDDFKTLLFGACGIGIVGGAFCILRKKLT